MAAAMDKQLPLKEELANLHWSFWLGVAFFVAVIVAILSFGIFLNKNLSSEESAPVTSIAIAGEMPYTTRLDIERAIEQVNLGNFFNLDVNDVQQKVAKLPWVYSVSVRKKWPDELKIYVVDQKPIAHWNGDFLLNANGNAFQADVQRLVKQLPAFFGPEGSEQIALDNFRNLNKLLDFSQLAIDELVLTERFAWQLILNDGVTINLGRDNRVERIQRFMDIYPEIKLNKKQDQQVDYVDLRYDTGLAVGWKAANNKERV
ncbi:FtsQ-type POTRA domain-containing protein [Colwellia sp. MB3u-70]|nr:FtsQ-type POTRA domain-containing protein [Colwellia sp. MB3u-8]MBA6307995.1 FtsQ-type POTRA domain-containing protein [Colwellia sp. MB3u-70]